jgi:hypothetical protein
MLIKQDELVNTLSTLHYTYIKYPLGGTLYMDVSIKNPLSAFRCRLPFGQLNGNAAMGVRRWGATVLYYGMYHLTRTDVWLPRSHPLT